MPSRSWTIRPRIGIMRPRTSSSTPARRSASMPRAASARLIERPPPTFVAVNRAPRSITTGSKPRCASSIASRLPAGPPPMIAMRPLVTRLMRRACASARAPRRPRLRIGCRAAPARAAARWAAASPRRRRPLATAPRIPSRAAAADRIAARPARRAAPGSAGVRTRARAPSSTSSSSSRRPVSPTDLRRNASEAGVGELRERRRERREREDRGIAELPGVRAARRREIGLHREAPAHVVAPPALEARQTDGAPRRSGARSSRRRRPAPR